jgi:invasion protein IalB
MNKIIPVLGTFCLLLMLAIQPASAQTKEAPAAAAAPPPAPVSADPQNTSATYGDWVVRCSRTGEGAQILRVCEVVQSIQVQGQGLIAQIALGRPTPKEALRVTALLPSNISFPSIVKIGVDEKDNQAIDLIWRRCVQGGCFADTEMKDETLKHWKTQTGNGRLEFKDSGGRDIDVPFSFRGLSQAMDGLAKTGP